MNSITINMVVMEGQPVVRHARVLNPESGTPIITIKKVKQDVNIDKNSGMIDDANNENGTRNTRNKRDSTIN